MRRVQAAPAGPVGGTVYQLGYVTRDLAAAKARFSERFGIEDYLRTQISYPGTDGFAQVALAFNRGMLVELTQPVAGAEGLFADALPDGYGIALHHLGHRVDDAATLERVVAHYEALGYAIPLVRTGQDGPTTVYVDTRPDTGHYSEFVHIGPGGKALLDRIPRF